MANHSVDAEDGASSSHPSQAAMIGKYKVDVLLDHAREKYHKRTKDWDMAQQQHDQHHQQELPRYEWNGKLTLRYAAPR